MNVSRQRYLHIVDEVCSLRWGSITQNELCAVAWAYYYFSVQFRENLLAACELLPDDKQFALLREGECDTDNLSPYPGIAVSGERMNHDEFMRRLIERAGLPRRETARLKALGMDYLAQVRGASQLVKALSISSYEDGGLERVFRAILTAPKWDQPAMRAFQHFLLEHIRFDTDPDGGHGALSRHLVPDDRIVPLWSAFRDMLIAAVPQLRHAPAAQPAEHAYF